MNEYLRFKIEYLRIKEFYHFNMLFVFGNRFPIKLAGIVTLPSNVPGP
jgi:hypothetical protein